MSDLDRLDTPIQLTIGKDSVKRIKVDKDLPFNGEIHCETCTVMAQINGIMTLYSSSDPLESLKHLGSEIGKMFYGFRKIEIRRSDKFYPLTNEELDKIRPRLRYTTNPYALLKI